MKLQWNIGKKKQKQGKLTNKKEIAKRDNKLHKNGKKMCKIIIYVLQHNKLCCIINMIFSLKFKFDRSY